MGSACVFPFKFRGDTITNCTTIDGDTKPWCSTKTNADGIMVSGSWGYCPDDNCSGSGSGYLDHLPSFSHLLFQVHRLQNHCW